MKKSFSIIFLLLCLSLAGRSQTPVSPIGSLSTPMAGDSFYVDLPVGCGGEVVEDIVFTLPSWITYSYVYQLSYAERITFAVSPNLTGQSRSGVILQKYYCSNSYYETVYINLTVSQDGLGTMTLSMNSASVSPMTTAQVAVENNYGRTWQVIEPRPFVNLSSDTGQDNDTITLSYNSQGYMVNQVDTLVIQSSDGTLQQLVLTQTSSESDFGYFLQDHAVLPAPGGLDTVYFHLTDDYDYELSALPSWITLKYGYTKSKDWDTLVFGVAPYTGLKSRIDTIVFTSYEVDFNGQLDSFPYLLVQEGYGAATIQNLGGDTLGTQSIPGASYQWFYSAGDSNSGATALLGASDSLYTPSAAGYYQVRIISGGDTSYSAYFGVGSITAIVAPEPSAVLIYPNPAHNFLNIVVAEATPNYTLTIVNNWGQQVVTAPINAVVSQISLSALTPGLYLIQGWDAQGHVVLEAKKLLIE